MTDPSLTEQLAQRVELLLQRHAALLEENEQLAQQLQAVTEERDRMQSRLSAARSRVDALLARLPENIQATAAVDAAPSEGATP